MSLAVAGLSFCDAASAYWRLQAIGSPDPAHGPRAIPAWVAGDPQVGVLAAQVGFISGAANPRDFGKIAETARAALRARPLNPAALFLLGMAAENENAGSGLRYFELAERVSRREVLNELALESSMAGAGDFPGAVARIDHAVSVAPDMAWTVFEPLVPALPYPAVRNAFVSRAKQPWYPVLMQVAIDNQGDPETIMTMINAAAGKMDPAKRAEATSHLISKVVSGGDVATARRLVGSLTGNWRSATSVFGLTPATVDPQVAPLNWILANTLDNSARFDGKNSMAIEIAPEKLVTVALRTTLLAPGNYELAQTLTYDDAQPRAGLSWELVCMGPAPTTIWRQPMSHAGNAATTYRTAIAIPAACPVQQWRLQAFSDDDRAPARVNMGGLKLLPESGR